MKEFWIVFTSLFILCSECFCAYNHSFALNQRTKRQFDCDGFKCKRGRQECIDSEKMCDGIVDCQDGSDESNDLCSKIHCPEDLFFQCAYGACIDLEKKCNGKKDCKDNSDEENCIIIDKDKQKCSQEEFECDNGLCIEVEGKCNGVVECSDGSDETERTCLNTYCPEVYFKCAYGACVDGNAKCNGIKDCYDNSDERPTLCNQQNPVTFAPTTGRVCETPANPEHGTWRYYFNGSPYYPRTQVGIDTTIQLSCDEGWLPSITDEDNTKIMICKESGWTVLSNIVCQRKCPEIYNTANMNVTCRKNSGLIIPCNKATTGTTLTLKCKPYYESRSHSYVRRCQANGEWNKEIGNGECIPACGEKKVSATKLIVNGSEVERGHYPWTVAIYQLTDEWKQICGGSVISLRLVLTAAHCVTDDDGTPLNEANFVIAAGKYFRPYNDKRDKDTAKYSKISKLIVHEEYQGDTQNYKADIALMLLQNKLPLTQEIQPVCLAKSNLELIRPNQTGVVTGWGYTEASGGSSDTLQELELPYKEESQCRAEMPYEWFIRYYKTGDKICAGFYHRSTSVCQGDSGGGLAFNHTESYEGGGENPLKIKYHIIGIVSIGRQERGKNRTFVCDIQKSALYTKVPKYLDWINYQISLYP